MLLQALVVAALAQAPASPDLSWMAGYWLECSEGREVSETWSDSRGGLMVGHALTLEGGHAAFESSRIAQGPQGLAYFAQPGGAPPTLFALTEGGAARAVFANAENDFPTRIVYEREGDVLTARIEGEIGGESRRMEWAFRAAPLNTRCPA